MLNEEGLKAAVKAYAEREMGKGCPVWEDDFPPMRAAITAYLSTVEKAESDAVREPGFDWTVSPETEQAMRDIDDSIRAAHMQASTTFVGSTHPADRDGVEARTIDEWHEDDGSVCWWALDENGQWLGEPAYIGSPLDLGRAYSLSIGEHEFVATLGGWPGYHTHWTPHPAFPTPPASATKGGA